MTTTLTKPYTTALALAGAPMPADLMEQLSPHIPAPVFGYEWFSSPKKRAAVECVTTIVSVYERESPARLAMMATMLTDLYDQDRAQRACSLLPEATEPILDVPRIKWLGSSAYHLTFQKITTWAAGVPANRFATIARIERETWPDDYYLATYQRLPDPILYAKYGAWYVALAQWE
jgi:hypothetical protein